jgi:hypothetical protein
MDQALKPGGILVIQGYSKDQLKYNTGGPGKLDHLYDEATLRQAFSGYEVLVSHLMKLFWKRDLATKAHRPLLDL